MPFLYLLANKVQHDGLSIKAQGQLGALKRHYHSVKFLHLATMGLFSFHIKAVYISIKSQHIFFRYNPKVPFLVLWLSLLSWFKPVFFEHNILLYKELSYLKRYGELWMHSALLIGMSFGRIIHICASDEIAKDLKKRGLDNTTFVHNGYALPDLSCQKKEDVTIQKVIQFKKGKLAVFTGNGYDWHGLDRVLNLIEQYPFLQLLVIGPYPNTPHPQVMYTGAVNQATLYALYEFADFAISTFAWDRIGTTQGTPLKSREYLCHGLPILVNYEDGASTMPALSDYVFSYQKDNLALEKLLCFSYDKSQLIQKARQQLSWDEVWKDTVLKNITSH